MVAVSFRSVSKVFDSKAGNITALDDVSAEVPEGSIFGVVGTSGAGKSTLLRTVNGLEKPTSGTVRLLGKEVSALKPGELRALRRDVSMVFQHYNLLGSQTVAHNVGLPLILAGTPKAQVKKRVAEVLAMVGLEDRAENSPKQLSGGQRQRVGIARALVTNPQILVCDEPTSALDPITTNQILDLLMKVNSELGITVLIITHQMSVVSRIADQVAVMEFGRVIESGDVAQVFAHPQQELTRQFVETVVPQKLPLAIEQEVKSGKFNRVIRAVHTGGAARDLISDFGRQGVHASLLHASDAALRRQSVGTVVLGLSAADATAIESALANLAHRPGLDVEEVN
ncbi:methionine ABC transporter ATP-binding protein [Corynebacterium casei]|uniref:methionine ABC transporter ATP-binding protein n=1 Tax=Corynebacterium casei TaxID=160386 RepID=UPI003FD5002D